MFALLKRYRELVVTLLLLALPFATYLSHVKHGRDLNRFDQVVLALTGPLQRGLEGAVGAVQDVWGGYLALRGVRQENLALRAQVLHLKEENLGLLEARRENERLRRMLDFAQAERAPLLPAEVVGTGLSPTFLSLRIARGERDGVRKEMAVVTPEGVVGKVQQVSASYADVLLVEDVNSLVAVETQRTRARATVRGAGESKLCRLELAERSGLFEDGDLLITSGTDGVFPKGLAVGRVAHLQRKKFGLYLAAEVVPAVDVARVEEVMVVIGPPSGGETPSAAAEPRFAGPGGKLP